MRWLIVIAGLIVAPAATAQTPPATGQTSTTQPDAEKPLYRFPGLPDLPTNTPDARRSGPRGQLFVSPAGEPFRAEPGLPYPSAVWFAQADGDHDGKIDRSEFNADFDRFFGVLDINRDQVIDPSEVTRYERDVLPEVTTGDGSFGEPPRRGRGGRPDGGRPSGGPGDGGRQRIAGGQVDQDGGGSGGIQAPPPKRRDDVPIVGAGRYGMINIPEPVTSMDINLDGTITRYESRQAAIRRFALLDPDNRGFLRLADLPHPDAQRSGEGNKRRRGREDR